MAIINGTDLVVKFGDKKLGHATTCTLDLSIDLSDTTSKDDAGWSTHLQGVRGGTIDFEGFSDPTNDDGTTAQGTVNLIDLYLNRTSTTVYFGTEEVGDVVYTATASLTSCNVSADAEQPVTYSGQFVINGEITKVTLT